MCSALPGMPSSLVALAVQLSLASPALHLEGSGSACSEVSARVQQYATDEDMGKTCSRALSSHTHAFRDQTPGVDPPDTPKSTSSASVLQSSEDLLSRSLEDMLDGLEQLPPSKVCWDLVPACACTWHAPHAGLPLPKAPRTGTSAVGGDLL